MSTKSTGTEIIEEEVSASIDVEVSGSIDGDALKSNLYGQMSAIIRGENNNVDELLLLIKQIYDSDIHATMSITDILMLSYVYYNFIDGSNISNFYKDIIISCLTYHVVRIADGKHFGPQEREVDCKNLIVNPEFSV